MQTKRSAEASVFVRVEGRPAVAEFDGGVLTSDAGGLLLGAADRTIDLVRRLAAWFVDARDAKLVERSVATLVGQRVLGSRSATRISTIMTSFATIQQWRFWRASSRRGVRIARRWPANRRSTGWS